MPVSVEEEALSSASASASTSALRFFALHFFEFEVEVELPFSWSDSNSDSGSGSALRFFEVEVEVELPLSECASVPALRCFESMPFELLFKSPLESLFKILSEFPLELPLELPFAFELMLPFMFLFNNGGKGKPERTKESGESPRSRLFIRSLSVRPDCAGGVVGRKTCARPRGVDAGSDSSSSTIEARDLDSPGPVGRVQGRARSASRS